MRKLFIITSLLFITLISKAGVVPIETAQKAALNFYCQQIVKELPSTNTKDIYIKDVFTISNDGQAVYYIINIGEIGYIVISAEDNTYPILAYSFESSYNPAKVIPPFAMWMNHYKDQIVYAREKAILANSSIKDKWQQLLNSTRALSSNSSVSPFTKSKWNQDGYFNVKCPADTAGPGDHVYTGCVATCLAQLMYYYRFPDYGTSSYQYLDSTYGIQSYNYQTTNIKWNNMLDVPTTANPAISYLMYGCGVAVDMKWGPAGSGMYNHSAAHCLKTYYKYSQDVTYLFKDSITINWDSVMVSQLDKKMPMYYAGWSVPNVDGHAFVCDGYQDTTYFHFNFGWGGAANGYFYLNNLTPSGNNFNLAQELIVNIYPDTTLYTYPVYCSGQVTVTANEGSITNECQPVNKYQNNSDCSWLIQPQADSVSSITLSFTDFATQANHDYLKVYAGSTTAATLVGTYSGSTLPANLTVNSSTALLKFTSDADTVDRGFSLNYKANTPSYCQSSKFLFAASGNFTDGSGTKKYNSNTDCKWYIVPTGAGSITLHFNNFETESGKDILYVKNDNSPYNTFASYSGSTFPNDVTFNVSHLMVEFISDYENEYQGFDISYSTSGMGIGNLQTVDDLTIYPNPAHNALHLTFNSSERQDIYCHIYSIDGKLLLSDKWNGIEGKQDKTINVGSISSGVYLLELKNKDNETFRQKIIIN